MWVSFLEATNESGSEQQILTSSHASFDEINYDQFEVHKRGMGVISEPSLSTVSVLPQTPKFSSPILISSAISLDFSLNSTSTNYKLFSQQNWEDIFISSVYGVLFLIGVIGNVSVMMTICRRGTGQPQPHRHSLILSLNVADLLISLLCYPMNAISHIMPYISMPFPACHVMVTVQGALHASSTFSMALLAFDRFITVRKPKMAPKVARWLPQIMSVMWIFALVVALPRGLMIPHEKYLELRCVTEVRNNEEIPWRIIYLLYFCFIAFLVYVLPCIIVFFCHFEVSSSLRKRGLEETKLQQRPRQIIIVTQDCSAAGNPSHKIVAAPSSLEPSEEEPKARPQKKTQTEKGKRNRNRFFSSSPSPTPIRPSKSMKTIIRAHRRLRVRKKVRSTLLLADHRTHSVKTRMRLAKFLTVLSIIFIICWIPYACALVVWSFLNNKVVNKTLNFCLLLGHTHSAISPIVYWLMNRSILTSVHRLMSSYLHWPNSSEPLFCGACPRPKCLRPIQTPWGNNSSTNEDALGPFHPKYVNPIALRPQPSRCTSHYFH